MKKKYKSIKVRWVSLLFVVTVAVMMLSGCGQQEAMSSGAQIQEGTSDMIVGSSTSAEGATDGDGVAAQAEDSQEDMEAKLRAISQQQLEMDEETRQQLTAELLEENELDTSVIEAGRSTGGCTFDIPEGFEESEEVDNLYVTAHYPLDTSMIYYEVMEGDTSLQLMTAEMFQEQAEENLRQVYGEDTEINIDSYESVKISGHPAFRILCHYETESIKITQLEYIINADKTYAITYSQTSDYDWMEAFEASAATIRVR